MTSEDIGVKLGIAARTANFHIANVMHKLDALNRREAVAIALSVGLISLASARTSNATAPDPLTARPLRFRPALEAESRSK